VALLGFWAKRDNEEMVIASSMIMRLLLILVFVSDFGYNVKSSKMIVGNFSDLGISYSL
jgi:hypothetical protein